MARILVIDDSRLARRALRRALERGGHDVIEVDRARTGLETLKRESFDCATSDVLMPETTGVEFLGQVRDAGLRVPVIIVTADIQKSTRRECLERGAWTVLPKPVDEDELLAQVAAATSARGPESRALTAEQRDALTEVINVGVGRAASALSTLIEGRVELKVPHVDLVSKEALGGALHGLATEAVSSVQMGFKGSLHGSAFLVFPSPSAAKLVELVAGSDPQSLDLDSIQASTLTEIGNIVISAVMGTLATIIDDAVRYSLPVYEQHPILELLERHQEGNPLILLAKTSFTIRQTTTIEGHLLLVFEISSLDSLLAFLEGGRDSP